MAPKLIGGNEAPRKVNRVQCIYGTEAVGDFTVFLANQPGAREELSRHGKERLFFPVQKHFQPSSSPPDLGRRGNLKGKTVHIFLLPKCHGEGSERKMTFFILAKPPFETNCRKAQAEKQCLRPKNFRLTF